MRTDACGKAARSLSLLVCPTVFDYFMCALSPQLIDQGEPARRKLASDIGKVVPGLEQALYGAATSRDVYIDRDTLKDRLEMVAEWMLRDCLIRQRGVPEVDLGQLALALGDMSIASIR
ncbi:hypothetical protein CVIRNUC_004527 [Coccomyxa viridis]|uniref:Uncharacterized protein n=1 Tax=Coccomyxa viridis TaxID=1274662 RepID=A0AAV1I2V1_9CHLO|nr:hypothetical protein CVIRNUC_004527 [Coccomyxa viridis]